MGTLNFVNVIYQISPLLLLFLIGIITLWIYFCIVVYRKGKLGRIIGVVLILVPAIMIYFSINPPQSFYKSEYQNLTGRTFPKASVFIDKYSTFPDVHGDYFVCGIFVAPKKYIKELSEILPVADYKNKKALKCTDDLELEIVPTHWKNMDDKKKNVRAGWGISSKFYSVYFRFYSH